MKLTIALVIMLLVMPMTAYGADKHGRLFVFHPGSQSCRSYADARKQQENSREMVAFITWLHGYLTAYNHLISDTYNIGGGSRGLDLREWLDNYCKENPRKSFYQAAAALTVELYPKRLKEEPKPQ